MTFIIQQTLLYAVPLMIVALAGMVGTIVIALFLPLTKIIEKMSG